jgi:hypothetical protein
VVPDVLKELVVFIVKVLERPSTVKGEAPHSVKVSGTTYPA